MQPSFTLDKVNGQDVIGIAGTYMRITVFRIHHRSPDFPPDELVLYGDDRGAPLAFVTTGYNTALNPDELRLIIVALHWYARYLEYPEMSVSITPPSERV